MKYPPGEGAHFYAKERGSKVCRVIISASGKINVVSRLFCFQLRVCVDTGLKVDFFTYMSERKFRRVKWVYRFGEKTKCLPGLFSTPERDRERERICE